MRPVLLIAIAAGVVLVLVAGGVVYAVDRDGGSGPKTSFSWSSLPGLQDDQPPWTEGLDQLEPRVDKLGFQLGPEMLSYHIHAHLDVYVDGKKETVPQGVGIDPLRAVFASLHTHDTTGIVHVEAASKRDFTLGQFFAVWGVKLTNDQLGPFSNTGDQQVRVYAGGKPVADPFHLPLSPHEEIAVTYGAKAQLPTPIPSSYRFPEGY